MWVPLNVQINRTADLHTRTYKRYMFTTWMYNYTESQLTWTFLYKIIVNENVIPNYCTGNGSGAYVQLHVSDETTINDEQTRCGYYNKYLPTNETVTITCTNNRTGQFVTLYRDYDDYKNHYLVLCEVVVMGVRLIGENQLCERDYRFK